jgi:hypothetical protein
MSSETSIRQKIVVFAPYMSQILYAALGRELLSTGSPHPVLQIGEDELDCDFTNPDNLPPFDAVALPFINDMLGDVHKLKMTAIEQMFDKPFVRYALVNGVTRYSATEIITLMGRGEIAIPPRGAVGDAGPRLVALG